MSRISMQLISLACLLGFAPAAHADATLTKTTLKLEAGNVEQLKLKQGDPTTIAWKSADPKIAAVYGHGYVCGIHPGQTTISAGDATCTVTIVEPNESLVTAASLKQYPDNRRFTVKGRKCYGSEDRKSV